MLLSRVVETSQRLTATSRRTEKTAQLAALLTEARGGEAPEHDPALAVAFLSGEPRQGKIGIGYRAAHQQRPSPAADATLTLAAVDHALTAIAEARGAAKAERWRALQAEATAAEQAFLARLLTGELRQGALEGVMAEAIAQASSTPSADVRRALMLAGNLPAVAEAALLHGSAGLAQFALQLFRPLQPMLAGTADNVDQAISALGEAALEYKMDGARVQVHRAGDDVRVYTRNLNDVTAAVPEVVELVRTLPGRELVLDGEVLALAPDGRPQPFQTTMRRFGRKLDIARLRDELPLAPFFFDVLHLDGTTLLDEPQRHRFNALRDLLPQAAVMPHVVTAHPEAAADFARQAIAAGHEGVVAKSPAAAYLAGARGATWLKVKQARTLDLVILAAEWGSGRRQGWLSNLHLGAREPATGAFLMLGKTFKGLTDEMLAWQTRELLAREVARDHWTVHVRPELVAEIAFNEIQTSTRYPAGLALRFARVKRYRPDKMAAEADTIDTVRRLA